MRFPTGDAIAAVSCFLQITGIEGLVQEARPELAEVTAVAGDRPALTVDLPPSPAGYHNRVVLGHARGDYFLYWLIVGSRTYDLVKFAWDLGTAEAQLRDALLATYDACLAKSEVASPWRWAEPARSTVVRVAEGLTAAGLEVGGVVSANRLMPDQIEGAGKPHIVPTEFGDALRVKMPWGIGTLARKPTLGWVFDASDRVVTRRVDLARYITDTISLAPGFLTDDADLLVQAVVRVVNEAEWDPEENCVPHVDIDSAVNPLNSLAASWLRELGYPAVEAHNRDRAGVSGPLHVVTTGKRVGLGPVKAAFADAALHRKPLVMFAEGGYTRNASAWATQASVALFAIDTQSRRIYPANALAREHMPAVM